MPHIIVLGAGVIGLQCAITLLEAGHRVTIIAAQLPGDQSTYYTSPWAGAHWRTHAGAGDLEEQGWDMETYRAWLEQIERPQTVREKQELGLKIYDSHNYWDFEPSESLWWAPHVQGFTPSPPDLAPPQTISAASPASTQIHSGATFRSIAINVPQYLLHLRARILALDGVFIRAQLPPTASFPSALAHAAATAARATGAEGHPDAFVNATGLGARGLCADEAVHPVKGQTVLVRGEADAIRTRIGEGYIAYVIPRPGSGTTILGGTKVVGNGEPEVDEEVTRRILGRCGGLAPELLTGEGERGFEVLGVQVGFRPARRGGARVEVETIRGEKERWTVVHAYGHAGAGYQNSIGCAGKVRRLVEDALATAKL